MGAEGERGRRGASLALGLSSQKSIMINARSTCPTLSDIPTKPLKIAFRNIHRSLHETTREDQWILDFLHCDAILACDY